MYTVMIIAVMEKRTVTTMKDDTISRQAAIDIVRHECGEWRGIAKEIVKQFNELPSAQSEQRWIPFSERRPWEGQQILVCAEDGVMWMTVFRSLIGFSGAWLPMPEPYRQEGADMRGDGNG